MFLKKKLLVIPMTNQYEQQCNAAAMEQMGVPVLWDQLPDQFESISNWLESDVRVSVDYPDQTRKIVRKIFEVNVKSVIWQNSRELVYQYQF